MTFCAVCVESRTQTLDVVNPTVWPHEDFFQQSTRQRTTTRRIIYKKDSHHRTTTKHKKYHEVVNAQEELPANAET